MAGEPNRLSPRAVVIGAGGHGQVVAEAARMSGRYDVVGFVDADPALQGRRIQGIDILGDLELLAQLPDRGVAYALVGVGGAGDNSPRREVFERIRASPLQAGTVAHPNSVVSPSAVLGEGSAVCAGAVVCAGCVLGADVIVNTGAVVDHHCVVGDHVHISPGAALAGGVRVAEMAHIGLGASVIQNILIGSGAIVGAGAVVVRDVPGGATVAGAPAVPIRARARESTVR